MIKNKKIKEGDIIFIEGEKYDVLKIQKEIDSFSEKKGFIGEYTEIDLHIFGNKKLTATHIIKIYPQNKVVLQKLGLKIQKSILLNNIKIIKNDN